MCRKSFRIFALGVHLHQLRPTTLLTNNVTRYYILIYYWSRISILALEAFFCQLKKAMRINSIGLSCLTYRCTIISFTGCNHWHTEKIDISTICILNAFIKTDNKNILFVIHIIGNLLELFVKINPEIHHKHFTLDS